MAAVAAGYRKSLVSAAWPALLLSCTNGCRKRSFHLLGTPFLAYQAAFCLRAQPIERLVMSECVRVMNLQRASEESCGPSFSG